LLFIDIRLAAEADPDVRIKYKYLEDNSENVGTGSLFSQSTKAKV